MNKVIINTGSEFHSTNGSKGFVFVVVDGKEDYIYNVEKAVTQDWDTSKHCKRVTSEYNLVDGTILKAVFEGTGKNKGKVTGYFVVDSYADEVEFCDDLSKYSGYFVKGNLVQFDSLDESQSFVNDKNEVNNNPELSEIASDLLNENNNLSKNFIKLGNDFYQLDRYKSLFSISVEKLQSHFSIPSEKMAIYCDRFIGSFLDCIKFLSSLKVNPVAFVAPFATLIKDCDTVQLSLVPAYKSDKVLIVAKIIPGGCAGQLSMF